MKKSGTYHLCTNSSRGIDQRDIHGLHLDKLYFDNNKKIKVSYIKVIKNLMNNTYRSDIWG